MPFTPVHLGPAFLAKALFYERVSVTAFATSQVVMDAAVAVRIACATRPLHGAEHSLVGAVPVGLVSALGVWLAGRRRPSSETRLRPSLVGGLFGSLSHPVVDAFFHPDIHLLAPFTDANPLFGTIPKMLGLELLAATAVVGGVLLIRRVQQARRAARRRVKVEFRVPGRRVPQSRAL